MYLMQCPVYKCPCQFVQLGCPKIAAYMTDNTPQNPDTHEYESTSPVKKSFTTEDAYRIGKKLGINWKNSNFDVEQYRMGLDVELEHGRKDPYTNVTNDNPITTGKIALAHLREFPDYYTRLAKLESEAKAYWGIK